MNVGQHGRTNTKTWRIHSLLGSQPIIGVQARIQVAMTARTMLHMDVEIVDSEKDIIVSHAVNDTGESAFI